MKIIHENLTSTWKRAESDLEKTDTARRETEDEANEECLTATVVPKTEGKPLVLIQVICRSIYKKTSEF